MGREISPRLKFTIIFLLTLYIEKPLRLSKMNGILKATRIAYEISLRLIAFLLIGLVITMVFTIDSLTGSLWISMHHWVYGALLADVATIVCLTAFAPEVAFDLWSAVFTKFKLLAASNGRVTHLLKDLKNLSLDKQFAILHRYFAGMKNDIKLPAEEKAVKIVMDGLETGGAYATEGDPDDPYDGKVIYEDSFSPKDKTIKTATVTLVADTDPRDL